MTLFSNKGIPLLGQTSAKRFGLTSAQGTKVGRAPKDQDIGLTGPRVGGLIDLALVPPDVCIGPVGLIPDPVALPTRGPRQH